MNEKGKSLPEVHFSRGLRIRLMRETLRDFFYLLPSALHCPFLGSHHSLYLNASSLL